MRSTTTKEDTKALTDIHQLRYISTCEPTTNRSVSCHINHYRKRSKSKRLCEQDWSTTLDGAEIADLTIVNEGEVNDVAERLARLLSNMLQGQTSWYRQYGGPPRI